MLPADFPYRISEAGRPFAALIAVKTMSLERMISSALRAKNRSGIKGPVVRSDRSSGMKNPSSTPTIAGTRQITPLQRNQKSIAGNEGRSFRGMVGKEPVPALRHHNVGATQNRPEAWLAQLTANDLRQRQTLPGARDCPMCADSLPAD